MKLRVGTRPSRLALLQVNEVMKNIGDHKFDVITIATSGDIDKNTSLIGREKTDFFTDKIERALLEGKIDFAVHSAKDLEENIVPELEIAAITKSVSIFDCLVSKNNLALNELAYNAVIGTSSMRRQNAVRRFRSDLVTANLRGNVDDRIDQLDKGRFDAIIVAHAALLRLGLHQRITQILPESIIDPHPLQGKLAIQILRGREDVKKFIERIYAE